MNLILMVLRLLVGLLFPTRRDRLSLAARADGRMEHVPQSAWDWLLGGSDPRPSKSRPAAPRGRPPTASPRPGASEPQSAPPSSGNG